MNAQGLVSKHVNKLQSPEIITLFNTHDIILFTETWTNEYSNLHVDGFEHYVLHRLNKSPYAKRDSGGIAVYVKSYLVADDTFVKSVDESQLVA